MIVHPAAQGTPEWLMARMGIPTASQFHRILTPTGKPSAQAEGYLYELVAERALGQPLALDGTDFMLRGSEMEAQAVAWYELQRDVAVSMTGLILRDGGLVGCSPDRLVQQQGGLEVKIPSASVHMAYLLGGISEKHKPQVQGCLWICEREWWDVLSFNPALPSALVRMTRDEEYIKALAESVDRFTVQLKGLWESYVDRFGAADDGGLSGKDVAVAAPSFL